MNEAQQKSGAALRELARFPIALVRRSWTASWARWGDLGVFWIALALGVLTIIHGGEHLSVAARTGMVVLVLLPWAARVLQPRLPALPLALVEVVLVTWLVVLDGDSFAFFFLPLLVGNTTATAGPVDGVVVAAAAAGAPLAVQLMYGWLSEWAYWSVPNLAAPVVGGLIGRLDQMTRQLAAAQEALVVQSAGEERRRIARELHDVIAHTLSVTLLNLTAARRALGDDHPEATEALEAAERLGRQSLGDLRRTVGLLSEAPGRAAATPQPAASDLPRLLESYQASGMDLRAQIKGDLAVVPAATGLELYRIVQEALANVVKHAPGAHADVDVEIRKGDVVLTVTNPLRNGARPSDGSGANGSGVTGMRERATLVSGTVLAGLHDKVWSVECRLPLSPGSSPNDR